MDTRVGWPHIKQAKQVDSSNRRLILRSEVIPLDGNHQLLSRLLGHQQQWLVILE